MCLLVNGAGGNLVHAQGKAPGGQLGSLHEAAPLGLPSSHACPAASLPPSPACSQIDLILLFFRAFGIPVLGSKGVPQLGLRWGPGTAPEPPRSQNGLLAQCRYLAVSANELHACPVITRLGVRSAGPRNLDFPLNAVQDFGVSHFVGVYNSLPRILRVS